MAFGEIKVRSYDEQRDRGGLEALERRCEVGPSKHLLLFTDTMGDPICRTRNSPLRNILVAEWNRELVGVIQGSIKQATVHSPTSDTAKVGYILGLRVSPFHRRKGIGSTLVHRLEQWFIANHVDYAYMATDKDNQASLCLFVHKLRYVKFRAPTILVHPIRHGASFRLSTKVDVAKLKVERAEYIYRRFMGSSDFFPLDIDRILRHKQSLGTWVAYYNNDDDGYEFGGGGRFPGNWAMLSVWNTGGSFKLRIGKAPIPCLIYAKSSRLIDHVLPCLKVPEMMMDFFHPFGFYFMYGLHREGPLSGKLVRTLCEYVHNMARVGEPDCKVVVTEVGGSDSLRLHIPHCKLLSDLWCIKALKCGDEAGAEELKKVPQTRALFVDPREV